MSLTITNLESQITGIEIFDMMGKTVATVAAVETRHATSLQSTAQTTIDISHLPAGIYFVRVQTEQGVVTRKIIKN